MAKFPLHHCVDSVSEKGAKHVAHKSSIGKIIDENTASKLADLRTSLEQ